MSEPRVYSGSFGCSGRSCLQVRVIDRRSTVKFIIRLLIGAAVIFGLAYLSGGELLQVESFFAALIAALVLGIVNTFVKPVVSLLALPVTILSLGLFSLVINAFMLYLVDWIVPGVSTVGFWRTVLAAIIIAVVTSVLNGLIERD